MREALNTAIMNEGLLLGSHCYVKADNGDVVECTITRVDTYVSKSGVGVNIHLKRPGTQNFPLCVNLYGYHQHNVSRLPLGFLTTIECAKFYSELG